MPDPTVSREALHALMRSGPLPGSLWADGAGAVCAVVTTGLRAGDLTPVVAYRRADGVVLVRPLPEWAAAFTPAAEGLAT